MVSAHWPRLGLCCVLLGLAAGGCGSSKAGSPTPAAAVGAGGIRSGPLVKTGATGSQATRKEVADPLEANSYPAPANVHHVAAATPAKAGEAVVAAGAASDAEIKAELKQMAAVEKSARNTPKSRLTPVPGGFSIGGDGTLPI